MPSFRSRKLSEAEQVQCYVEMRDSPTDWRKLLDEHGLRQSVAYAEMMEGRAGAAKPLSGEPQDSWIISAPLTPDTRLR